MNKKVAKYSFLYYIITMALFFIFPEKIMANFYIIVIYFIVNLILLYFIYLKKPSKSISSNNG